MIRLYKSILFSAFLMASTITTLTALHADELSFPNKPLVTNKVSPIVSIVMARDRKLSTVAYNDVSDIDGDGEIDTRFKPGITYFGLYDSALCYEYRNNVDGVTSISGGPNNSDRSIFVPVDAAGNLGVCTGATQWSGNWLNYVTTSRMDAVRKILYGGFRDTDTATQTVLRRAYIPQDNHSWAKEYTSIAHDGYNIENYTPLELPLSSLRFTAVTTTTLTGNFIRTGTQTINRPITLNVTGPGSATTTGTITVEGNHTVNVTRAGANGRANIINISGTITNFTGSANLTGRAPGPVIVNINSNNNTFYIPIIRRHFFGNLTNNQAHQCTAANRYCHNLAPLMRVVLNSTSRVWDWASSGVPNMTGTGRGSNDVTDYVVRVLVCTNSTNGCKRYESGVFKPVGLLHEFGDTAKDQNRIYFSLLTGSYAKNLSGGVLRAPVASFAQEINQTTGQFNSDSPIVNTINRIGISDFRRGSLLRYGGLSFRTGPMLEGDISGTTAALFRFPDWGNPLAEMLYENARYLAGNTIPTNSFIYSTGNQTGASDRFDNQLELPAFTTWKNPFEATSALSTIAWCSRPNVLVISDAYPTNDADAIPGNRFNTVTDGLGGVQNNNVTFDSASLLDKISNIEGISGNNYFIGEVRGQSSNFSPTPKKVPSLADIRGLAPDETTKQGSYYSAAVAYYMRKHGINVKTRSNEYFNHKIDSFFVTFSSPNPVLEIPMGTSAGLPRVVRIIPFGKSIAGAGINGVTPSRTEGSYQPNSAIVAIYVDNIVNTNSSNTNTAINNGLPQYEYIVVYESDEQGADFDMDVITRYTVSKTSDNTLSVSISGVSQSTGTTHVFGYVISGTTVDGLYMPYTLANSNGPYFLNTPPGQPPGFCTENINNTICRVENMPRFGGPNATNTFTVSGRQSASLLNNPLWYAAKWGGFNDKDNSNTPNSITEWDANRDGNPDNYFLVQNPLLLQKALRNSLLNILSRVEGAAAAAATSSPNITQTNNFIFSTTYQTLVWDGDVVAQRINPLTGAIEANIEWRASNTLNAQANEYQKDTTKTSTSTPAGRTLFTYNSAVNVTNKRETLSFSNLTASERGWFSNRCTNTQVGRIFRQCDITSTTQTLTPAQKYQANNAENVFNFFTGVNTPNKWTDSLTTLKFGYLDIFRKNRINRMGDNINATPLYVEKPFYSFTGYQQNSYTKFKDTMARRGTLYVGSNNGFLHAFDGLTGKEIWAYAPRTLLPEAWRLADDGYGLKHRYFVDGTPTAMDVYDYASNVWRTILVGGYRKGGRGYYGIDITDPNNPKMLWETCHKSSLCNIVNANQGMSYGTPVITRLPIRTATNGAVLPNSGRWVVLVTSGYQNIPAADTQPSAAGLAGGDGRGYLFVHDVLTGKLLETYATEVGGINTPANLSELSVLAPNFYYDGISTHAYAGDRLGNVWRFDLSVSGNGTTQGVRRVITTSDPNGKPQPITTRIELGAIPGTVNHPILLFGTGSYLSSADIADQQQQTIYGIKDPWFNEPDSNKSKRISELTSSENRTLVFSRAPDSKFKSRTIVINNLNPNQLTFSSNQTLVDWNKDYGWYIDLNKNKRERVTIDPLLTLGTLVISTNVLDDTDICSLGGFSWLYQLNYAQGMPLRSANEIAATKYTHGMIVGTVVMRLPSGVLQTIATTGTGLKIPARLNTPISNQVGRRISWRILGE